jgi:hypothetical protein
LTSTSKSRGRPKFVDSAYFVDEPGNWHLKAGAPTEVQEEFQAFVANNEDLEEDR